MPSKGIDFYAYVANGFTLELKHRDAGESYKSRRIDPNNKWDKFSFEIESNLWKGRYEGQLQFIVKKDGRQLYERSLRVNTVNGDIDDTDLSNFMESPIIENDYCVSFGLYDSDAGILSDLPNRHQVYVSVTPNMGGWQKGIFQQFEKKSGLQNLFLKNLFLPGSHDAGMYIDMPLPISNLANTQCNDIATQLKLGARYLDFRPGRLNPGRAKKYVSEKIDAALKEYLPFPFDKFIGVVKDQLMPAVEYVFDHLAKPELQHIHALIPGCTYNDMLEQIFGFLSEEQHHSEIIVIEITSSGLITEEGAVMPASKEEIVKGLKDMKEKYGVGYGDKTALKQSIHSLLGSNTRVVVLDTVHNDIKSKSYYDSSFESYDCHLPAGKMDGVMNRLSDAEVKSLDYLYFTFQLTANATGGGIYKGVMGSDTFTSPLRATKAKADSITFRYLWNDLLNYHNNETIILAGNDFYTNAFTHTAITVNQFKLDILEKFPVSSSNKLENDQSIRRGEFITSPSGRFQFIYQHDGNLVLYNRAIPLWASHTNGKGGDYFIVQGDDGNLVIYKDGGTPTWAWPDLYKKFKYVAHSRLEVQNDGNLVIYSPEKAIWASGRY